MHSRNTSLLIDCGLSLREMQRRLARLDFTTEQITGVLVTHEHSDHIAGIDLLARRYGVPVFMSRGTASNLRKPVDNAILLDADCPMVIGDLQVTMVPVSHDAREPTQFIIDDGRKRYGQLTDLGVATPAVMERYRGLDALMIEANHDVEMLASGPYPSFLKARVGGHRGHLNNRQAAELVAALRNDSLQHLVLGHLSEKNNHPRLARQAFVDVLGCDDDERWLKVADQNLGLDWQQIA